MPRSVTAFILVLATAFALATPPPTEAGPEAKPPRPRPTPTAKPTPTPAPTLDPALLEGIDVSHHQGSVDWSRVARAGKRFAFVRASAGSLTADTTYAANMVGARSAGLAVGSYHFANPDTAAGDASREATWFLERASIASGDLLPVLDLEVTNGLGPAAMTAWAQTWLADVAAATGVRPIIYTNPTFWSTSMANTDWFATNGYTVLWIAHWTTASQPIVPAGNWAGSGWTFWQYSSTGTVPGISGRVDLNRLNGQEIPGSLVIP